MICEKLDYFDKNPSELKKGAKKAICELVKENIKETKMPEIFETIEEAIKSDADFMIRSDHPEEYFSMAGLLTSATAEKKDSSFFISLYENKENKFKNHEIKCTDDLNKLTERILFRGYNLHHYLKLKKLGKEDILKEFNWTFQKKIEGINGVIFADPSIRNKYHLINMDFKTERQFILYTQFNLADNSIETNGWHGKIEDKMPNGIKNIHKIVENYEAIRNFHKFNKEHCYEMEYQIDEKGEFYFLQLRKIRDFDESDFRIDREKEKDELEGSFVIGKTRKEGIILKTIYPKYKPETIDESVEAITIIDIPLCGIRFPNLKALFYNTSTFDYFVARGFTHQSREMIGKVNITTHIPFRDKSLLDVLIERPLRYLSDGERCLIKRM
jgi:hypothetical protein